MSTLRSGKCYRKFTRPYTRKSKFKKKSFISTIPESKIVKYNFGNPKKQFKYCVKLVSKVDHNIRHNALESARQVINRDLEMTIGNSSYFMRVEVYPHHILRENKMLTGAHADRLQTGMAHAFGKPVGRAARVKNRKNVIIVNVDDNGLEIVKSAYKKAMPKLPGTYSVEIEELNK